LIVCLRKTNNIGFNFFEKENKTENIFLLLFFLKKVNQKGVLS